MVDYVRRELGRFARRGSAPDPHRGPHFDPAPTLERQPFRLGHAFGTVFGHFDAVEMHVRVANGKVAPGWRAARVHHHRGLAVPRTRLAHNSSQLVVHASKVERPRVSPDPPDNVPPFVALLIPI